MPILETQHLSKSFGSTQVLKDISFSLERGQALAIIGSSGSGKTTLLRCLNFLERPNDGKILVDGETNRYTYSDPPQAERRRNPQKTPALRHGLPVIQSFPAVYGAGECHACQHLIGKRTPRLQSKAPGNPRGDPAACHAAAGTNELVWPHEPIIRISYPAGSSSALQSRAPLALRPISSASMNRPPHWILNSREKF